MTDLATRPEIPIRVITPTDVRASVSKAKRSLRTAAAEIAWQVEMEAWRTLGYSSWTAMREAEYGGVAVMIPSQMRPEIVGRLRAAGLTQKEIANTAGVSEDTVQRDLKAANAAFTPQRPVTNSRGQQRPATYTRRTDDVIDAEIVEDDPTEFCTRCGADTVGCECAADEKTDPASAESVNTIACPTCHGTGKVTR